MINWNLGAYMLDMHGAFIVVRSSGVEPHILTPKQESEFYSRAHIVGAEKAGNFTFGVETLAVIPCSRENLEGIAMAEELEMAHAQDLRGMAACILMRMSINRDGGNDNQGGQGVKIPVPQPRKPSGGSRAKVPATANA